MSIAILILAPALVLMALACGILYWLYRRAEKDRKEESSRAEALEKDLYFTEDFAHQMWKEESNNRKAAEAQRDALQDKLSSFLCPHNDHIWVNGACKRCGRPKWR